MTNLQLLIICLFLAGCVAVAYAIGLSTGKGSVSTMELTIPEGPATGKGTYTPYLHLYIPQKGEGEWTKPFNDNLKRIDEFAATGKISEPTSYVPAPPAATIPPEAKPK